MQAYRTLSSIRIGCPRNRVNFSEALILFTAHNLLSQLLRNRRHIQSSSHRPQLFVSNGRNLSRSSFEVQRPPLSLCPRRAIHCAPMSLDLKAQRCRRRPLNGIQPPLQFE